jgi:U32 family peptidase
MKKNSNHIELMAPVGSWESLQAALKAGADSVYFGIDSLNMRMKTAGKFTISDLKKINSICKKNRVKTYLALNTVIYDNEMALARNICDAAKLAGIDAVIASDISVIEYLKKIKMPISISTQANVSNIEAVKFYSKYADVIVLARELTLEQIRNICQEIVKEKICSPSGKLLRIEVFIHGALCVSIAGKCYMSLAQYNHSANRGDCFQPCRRKYRVFDEETNMELVIDNQYVLSPKDLCTITVLDKIIDAGPTVLKIEGRGRNQEYVYMTVSAYRKAIELIKKNQFSEKKGEALVKELEKVFNRGFWKGGYYLGQKLGEWSGADGSKSTTSKTFVGNIKNYYPKKSVASILMDAGDLKTDDDVLITGPTTGIVAFKMGGLQIGDEPVDCAKKSDFVTFKVPEKTRKNDKVYVIREKDA